VTHHGNPEHGEKMKGAHTETCSSPSAIATRNVVGEDQTLTYRSQTATSIFPAPDS
jgi:hypothetical protein